MKKRKNETKTFVDGKEQESSEEEVPDKIPELEIPTPPEESEQFPDLQSVPKKEEPLDAQTVYDEGRSVGFQEGMIHAMEILNISLHSHQAKLKAKIEADKKEVSP